MRFFQARSASSHACIRLAVLPSHLPGSLLRLLRQNVLCSLAIIRPQHACRTRSAPSHRGFLRGPTVCCLTARQRGHQGAGSVATHKRKSSKNVLEAALSVGSSRRTRCTSGWCPLPPSGGGRTCNRTQPSRLRGTLGQRPGRGRLTESSGFGPASAAARCGCAGWRARSGRCYAA